MISSQPLPIDLSSPCNQIRDKVSWRSQGLWWLPLASEAGAVGPLPGAASALAEAAGDGGAELLRAAAAQRMNTETRRAVFCVVMGAQDCADASERLLRLPLKV